MALHALRAIARALSDPLTPSEVAEVLVDRTSARFSPTASMVYLADDSSEVTLAAARGVTDEVLTKLRRLPKSASLPLTVAIRTGEAFWCEDRETLLERFPNVAIVSFPAGMLQAAIALPFCIDHRVLGGIALGFSSERRFDESDRELLLTVADLAAHAIERSRLREMERLAHARVADANRAKDRFLATLSHELRSPLNVISGWVGMLQRPDASPARLVKGLAVIDRNVKTQLRLIEDVIDISRIVTGNLQLEVRPISLLKAAMAACDGVRPAAEAKGLVLSMRAADDDSYVMAADPERVQQVIGNLLSNAVKFTPRGGRIDVFVRRSKSNVIISVADTGEGIDESFLPHLFDRFRQADAAPTRRYGGLGLGLSIARHIVEMHGGTIDVASPGQGQGTTFTVTLPVRAVEALGVQETGKRPHLPNIEGLRILLCDDEDDAREMLGEVLRTSGADITSVASGDEALAWLATHPFDVFLCDVGMPDQDGHTVVRRLRSKSAEQGADVPAIAITAYASSSDAEQALAAGFQAHFAKPVDVARLLSLIASLARQKPEPASNAS